MRGLVKIGAGTDDLPFKSSFMARGDDTHKLPINADFCKKIGNDAGVTARIAR